VVLVGGSTLMPAVPKMIERVTGKKPYQGLSPHTAVAQGAAIHAAILEARYRGDESDLAEKVRKHLGAVRQENVNSHGLGIIAKNPKTGKQVNHVMIHRNTRLPVEVKRVFRTASEGQARVNVSVTEVTNLPAGLPKGSPVEVTYAFDKNGRIRVSARETTGGREATIEIERSGALSETDIDAYATLASDYQVE
jgi:molecular chaperone DnaK